MTTPTGQISLGNVRDEFGPSAAISGFPSRTSLGNYRVNQTIAGRTWRLDDGVPISGSISMSQLRGKTLNVVVDYSGSTQRQVNSASTYNSAGIVVGGFRSPPSSGSATPKKVFHVIRTKIISGSSISAISPTSHETLPQFYWGGTITSNTLGPFATSGTSGNGTNSGVIPLYGGSGSGASVIIYKGVRTYTLQGRGRTTYYYLAYYSAALISGGVGYSRNDSVVAYWDGRGFTFTVSGVSGSGPAFRTGSWSSVSLTYILTSTGVIQGTGGSGGNAQGNSFGLPGQPGGTAFFADHPAYLSMEGGGIRGGGGGGGGGGFNYRPGPDARFDGGGGGGGAGVPGGGGGSGGRNDGGRYGNTNPGQPGQPGSETSGGAGGSGGGGVVYGGPGGGRGAAGSPGQPGGQPGGAGGGAGFAIQRSSGISVTRSSNNGILGPIQ